MSFIHRIVLICLVASSITSIYSASVKKATNRIVGGRIIKIDQAPYTVQFRHLTSNYIACTGTLVAPQYVVTAAHCFNNVGFKQIVVVGGVSTLTESGVERKVADMIVHPLYDRKTLNTDLAVLKLDKPMEGKNITPIPLCTRKLDTNDYLQVSGWGLTAEKGQMSHYLKTVRLPIIPRFDCQTQYGFSVNNGLCAFIPDSDSACNGDSGGSAVNAGELCGVVSFGRECSSKYANVFTDVFKLRLFIEKFMKK